MKNTTNKKNIYISVVFLVVSMFHNLAFGKTPIVAVVTDIVSPCVRLDSSIQLDCDLLSEVSAGQKIKIGPENSITLYYEASGIEYIIPGPQHIEVGAEQPINVSGNIASKNLKLGELREFETGDESVVEGVVTFRSILHSGLTLKYPKDTIIEPHPTFIWDVRNNTENYHFSLYDNQQNQIWQSTTNKSFLTLPQDIELVESKKYRWDVTAVVAGSESITEGLHFNLMKNTTYEKLLGIWPDTAAPLSERLAFVVHLKRLGLTHLENKEKRMLAAEYPQHTALTN